MSRDAITLPGNRRFGLLFSLLCAIGAAMLWHRHHAGLAIAALAAGIAFVILAFVAPARLEPLNRAWMALGLALGAVFNPIVLGILFFGLITPIALVTRLFGRDELRLRKPAPGASLWIERGPPGPAPDTLRRQF